MIDTICIVSSLFRRRPDAGAHPRQLRRASDASGGEAGFEVLAALTSTS
jgi:hypothetical protein